jgi:hypothetical protein
MLARRVYPLGETSAADMEGGEREGEDEKGMKEG